MNSKVSGKAMRGSDYEGRKIKCETEMGILIPSDALRRESQILGDRNPGNGLSQGMKSSWKSEKIDPLNVKSCSSKAGIRRIVKRCFNGTQLTRVTACQVTSLSLYLCFLVEFLLQSILR